jgi:hypothetical protein
VVWIELIKPSDCFGALQLRRIVYFAREEFDKQKWKQPRAFRSVEEKQSTTLYLTIGRFLSWISQLADRGSQSCGH